MNNENRTSSGFIVNVDYNSKNDILIHVGNHDMFENYVKSVKLNGDVIKIWSQRKCDSWVVGDKKRVIIITFNGTVLEELEIEIVSIIKDKNKRFKWIDGKIFDKANNDVHFIINKITRTSNSISEMSLKMKYPQYNKNSLVNYEKRNSENRYSNNKSVSPNNNNNNNNNLDNVMNAFAIFN